MNKDKEIRCKCGKQLFGPANDTDTVYILKGVAVAQFAQGKINIKCRNCKRWVEGISQKILLV